MGCIFKLPDELHIRGYLAAFYVASAFVCSQASADSLPLKVLPPVIASTQSTEHIAVTSNITVLLRLPQIVAATNVRVKVVSCFRAGNHTIRQIYACAGVWVTPRILTLCFLDSGCPVIANNIDARRVVIAEAGGKDISDQDLSVDRAAILDQKLSVDLHNVLEFPNSPIITDCKNSSSDEDTFTKCVSLKMVYPGIEPLFNCGSAQGDKQRALCISGNSPASAVTAIQCVSNNGVSVAALQACSQDPAWSKVAALKACMEAAVAGKSDCLLSGLTPTQRAIGECLSDSDNHASDALACLGKSDPSVATQLDEIACATKAASDYKLFVACLPKGDQEDKVNLAACAAGDQAHLASCIAEVRPEYQAVAETLTCVQGGRDASSMIANCSDLLIKDEKTRAALACVAKGGSDPQELMGCAASSLLPPEIARYATCAATSDGPTSFALCAAAPMMNEEWRIAGECAVESGGNPVGFGGCTAGRLTLRELSKCFRGQIGKDCYGPNNTIVKAYSDQFNDLLHGPGPNNDIIKKAFKPLNQMAGGPHSVVRDPGQVFGGNNSVFHNPGQLVPHIKI